MKKKKQINNIYDIFDELHPKMTQDEFLSVCYDLRDLKLKDNPNIKLSEDELKNQIKIDILDDGTTAEFCNDSNKIILNKYYMDVYFENDCPVIALATLAHELEHLNQKFETEREIKELYTQSELKDGLMNYNLISYYEPINGYDNFEISLSMICGSEKAKKVVEEYKILLKDTYLRLHNKNSEEVIADLYHYLYINENLKAYTKTLFNSKKKFWFQIQTDIMDMQLSKEIKNIKKSSRQISKAEREKLLTNLKNYLDIFASINSNKVTDVIVFWIYLFIRRYNIMCYLYGATDEKFKQSYENSLNLIFNNKISKENSGNDKSIKVAKNFAKKINKNLEKLKTQIISDINFSKYTLEDLL